MKFVYADSLDYVDPNYDFLEDRFGPDREPYWDDRFAHEIFASAPYDGLLVSRSIVGDHKKCGKYTESQSMRFRRVGARAFLRYPEEKFPGSMMMGDCGAFAYHKLDEPPYSAEDMVEFYGDGLFTHGCSVDHVIFDFFRDEIVPHDAEDRIETNQRRFEITQQNAAEFHAVSERLGNHFTPLGVIQGWSPNSMAAAAKNLVEMGYDYLAVGGMVPLRSPQIQMALRAIRAAIGNEIRLHILGFAKAEQIAEFTEFNLTSFDTTSPLIRAFKDARNNYYAVKPEGGLAYYTALRIPQAIENNTLKDLAKSGIYSQEDLQARERTALDTLRAFDRGEAETRDALDAVMAYTAPLAIERDEGHTEKEKRALELIKERYVRTLEARPWQKCDCAICQQAGVEVIIFRASNRNKRRGMHNLQAYRHHLDRMKGLSANGLLFDVQSYSSAAE